MKFWKRRQEIAEEIEGHLRMAEADEIARREFGNELLIREVTRDMWGWTAFERIVRDLGYALRQMRRAPGFATVAILTLALGLGATTAMFSIVNGVLLEPLRFRDPGRLYLARYVAPPAANLKGDFSVNARHFHEWRTRCQSCEQVSLMHPMDITLTGSGEPMKVLGLEVSFNFFRTLGVQPAMGRDFLPEEDHVGANGDHVILSNALWRNQLGSDAGAIGRSVQLNGESYTVIGVMPADLHLPRGEQWGAYSGPAVDPQIFRPLLRDPSRAEPAGSHNYTSVIRLKPGVDARRAQDELTALISDFLRQYEPGLRPVLIPLRDKMTAGARSALWLLLGAVGAVLLIVCVNIGNLMLVRTASRNREAGVRMALGASRAEMFRLVLGEALVLVAIGGALGLMVAWGGLKAFAVVAPADLPRINEVGIDWRVVAFAGAASLLSTILCGVFPAWRLSRTDPIKGIRGQGTEGRIRTREWMVSGEVALSTLLLVISGLLLLSFFRLMRADKGFETAHVITQDISFLHPKYAAGGRNRFVPLIVEKLRQIPGVRAVGLTSTLPLRGEDWTDGLVEPGQPEASRAGIAPVANFRFVTPDYWRAMGIALKRGRFFLESEKDARVAVISENAARFLWPGRDPIGRHVRSSGREKSPLEVVGVVADVRANVEQDPTMMVYETCNFGSPIGVSIVVRTLSEPAAVIRSMRAALKAADPDMALAPVKTMDQIVDESVAARRFEMELAAAFALAALALASLGVYGVISFTVARRTPEIGLRMALGARGLQVAGMVARQGMRPVVTGLAAGVGCALLMGRLIASQLYGLSANDPATIVMVAVMLLAVAAGACWVPARRAMRIDPMRALRFE